MNNIPDFGAVGDGSFINGTMENERDFKNKINDFFLEFGKSRKMVLSTSEADQVSSRMMSIVQKDGILYFQTDIRMKKYRQIRANHSVALCIDNIQIQGICEEIGKPTGNKDFCDTFSECFKHAYDAYSSLENERLFAVKPVFIERWLYIDGVPYMEIFDIEHQQYRLDQYIGI